MVEKGYMTTPELAWIRAYKKRRKGKGRTMMEKRVIPFSPPDKKMKPLYIVVNNTKTLII